MKFDKLIYDPFCEGFLKDNYPAFDRRKAFRAIPQGIKSFGLQDLDKMLRFTILYLDPLSPFFDERDDKQRRISCIDALDLDKRERFLTEIDDNTAYWQMIVFEYFKMINATQFETWFSLKMSLHIMNARLRSATALKDSDRLRLTKEVTALGRELMEIQAELFPDERTQRIISEKATEDLGGYAEKHAMDLDFDKLYRTLLE